MKENNRLDKNDPQSVIFNRILNNIRDGKISEECNIEDSVIIIENDKILEQLDDIQRLLREQERERAREKQKSNLDKDDSGNEM